MPTIRIDDDVWRVLQKKAQAFVDTPNDVLRHVLGLNRAARGTAPKSAIRRLPRGQGTSDKEYYVPILEAVGELGGRAPVHAILDRVDKKVRGRLKPADFETLPSGGLRWRKRAQFARNDMVHRMGSPLLSTSSPRGTWEITAAGRQYLEQRRNGK